MNLTILPLHDSIDWDVSPESRSASIVLLRPDLTDALAVHITVAQPAGRRDFVISVDSLDDGTPRVSWSCATTRDAFRTISAYIAQRSLDAIRVFARCVRATHFARSDRSGLDCHA